ncbi:translation factor GTPase family protein [Bacillus tropicus]|uniref:TetM/TetW/TetO/TetS family tetracycline resistance ribosomal protection protein n=1 Tax=Bacillus tropicus TaxID=2026188 RepID=A0A5C5A8L4_9BACI|nr:MULTISPECIES: TetM/TetW/TetO/TetS family tetracycline resistance ribosomal protection protein [Bacillus]ALL24483.1 tetracycline resistance protein [Bacillus thuringiensis]EEM22061.1 GTP-binding elongation factor protein, TetM/TetO [Bacillus thuringiensis serovar tochigiensis BGSC 4Y1]MCB4843529.1 TetM/TetW/TetO/TetS family tetracycline resistance ribosomal protection protein [Bacillus tropicus]MCC1488588.1 TetM/TetW/TetO/TetS family tetracycline resistance ribosomal protection protein [Bacil
MTTINIGIVAHVDAGKTSLTERILYETNVIKEVGRVDSGSTQTDSMELERQRGITIKASVVSFFIDDIKVNVIDTPGHADFIAEVERSFRVLDGAILVISAVEGVQAQTKILMRTLQKLNIPTILFVNKIDRSGANTEKVVKHIKTILSNEAFPFYSVQNEGTKEARIIEYKSYDDCIERLAPYNESLLESYVNNEIVTDTLLREELEKQIQQANLYPIFFGSAMTGIGVTELLENISALLPANNSSPYEELSGVVFKIEREPFGEKIAYVRLFSGSLHIRKYVDIQRNGSLPHKEKIKKMCIFHNGDAIQISTVPSGEFCKVWGLNDIKIGDIIGERTDYIKDIHFAEPQMEAAIDAIPKERIHDLYAALMELCEEDPLIQVWKDDVHNELYIRLFGQVQKEVIETTLFEKYNLQVTFSNTRVVCIEKPIGIGISVEVMGEKTNPFYATVGFKVERGELNSGITYKLGVELGSLPLAFHKAIEDTVFQTLKQGLYGWEVTDISVTLTHTGYASPVTTASDFRNLTPLVLMDALKKAETYVYEPVNAFELTVPEQAISTTMYKLAAVPATFAEPIFNNDSYQLTGSLPVTKTENFKRMLHSFTEGEGIFTTKPAGFTKISAPFPTRKRVDYNPLNRKDYLLHVLKAY